MQYVLLNGRKNICFYVGFAELKFGKLTVRANNLVWFVLSQPNYNNKLFSTPMNIKYKENNTNYFHILLIIYSE